MRWLTMLLVGLVLTQTLWVVTSAQQLQTVQAVPGAPMATASAQAVGVGAGSGQAKAVAVAEPASASIVNNQAVSNAAAVSVNAGADLTGSLAAGSHLVDPFYYLAPFDDNVRSLPDEQLQFIRTTAQKEFNMFRDILKEAIDKKNSFAPSAKLIAKHSAPILLNMIKNRAKEKMMVPHIEPSNQFFTMLADLAEKCDERSMQVKNERGYTKANVDTDELYNRVDRLFTYVQKIIDTSPVAVYLKWDELILYKNDVSPINRNKPLVDEAAELGAMFRGMGYESTIHVAKKAIKVLRFFEKGTIPGIHLLK